MRQTAFETLPMFTILNTRSERQGEVPLTLNHITQTRTEFPAEKTVHKNYLKTIFFKLLNFKVIVNVINTYVLNIQN